MLACRSPLCVRAWLGREQQDRMLATSSAGLFDEKERELELLRGRLDGLSKDMRDGEALIRDQAKALMEAKSDIEEHKAYGQSRWAGGSTAFRPCCLTCGPSKWWRGFWSAGHLLVYAASYRLSWCCGHSAAKALHADLSAATRKADELQTKVSLGDQNVLQLVGQLREAATTITDLKRVRGAGAPW